MYETARLHNVCNFFYRKTSALEQLAYLETTTENVCCLNSKIVVRCHTLALTLVEFRKQKHCLSYKFFIICLSKRKWTS